AGLSPPATNSTRSGGTITLGQPSWAVARSSGREGRGPVCMASTLSRLQALCPRRGGKSRKARITGRNRQNDARQAAQSAVYLGAPPAGGQLSHLPSIASISIDARDSFSPQGPTRYAYFTC